MESILTEIDAAIRKGEDTRAREMLGSLDVRAIARQDRHRVAFLAYRANLESLGIRLLNPIVRSTPRAPKTATGPEKLYYALCLTSVGASAEALAIFKGLDAAEVPGVLLYQTFVLQSEWDYARAIPLLEEYVRVIDDPYQRLVGNVNLLSALIYERRDAEAERLLDAVLCGTGPEDRHRLIRAKVLQLGAAHSIYRRDWPQAAERLDRAQALLTASQGLDALFIRKWRAIHGLFVQGPSKGLAALEAVRSEAVARQHWESVRECDRFRAIATRDEALLHRVWFGTRYPSYRRWLLIDFGGDVTMPEAYSWSPGGETGGPLCDVASGGLAGEEASLASWPVPHRLLVTLCSDFYRPFRIGSLHAELFPDEYFNPASSPARVRASVRRLREWARKAGLALEIGESAGAYRIASRGPCRLLVPSQPVVKSQDDPVARLRAVFGGEAFSARAAAERIGSSLRTTIRVLAAAVDASLVVRSGKGPATRYRFPFRG